ncbi:MAG: LysM peptidoglycan-binding domain-containing protein, partial [Anaerolineales bacterium]|nr:LysM peptidoglycan-binding domain-containing protein [Anaerolineales bacterium]
MFRYTAPQLNTAQLTRAHLVQPGDTWDALARRYGLAPADLAPLQGVNPQREPVIGAVLALPDSGVEHAGALWRTADGSLLATALRFNRNPWAVALQNDLRHPYHPLAYQPLFLPGGAAPPRDLPVGFTQLDLSHVPAQPGQAIAYRGQTLQPITVTAKLSLAPLGSFGNGRFQLGLGGTGAFFGSQDPELAILPAGQPLWAQPWRFVDRQWDFEELTLTGSAAQINQADILAERERLFEIWNQASPTPQWTAGFRQPLDSYVFLS